MTAAFDISTADNNVEEFKGIFSAIFESNNSRTKVIFIIQEIFSIKTANTFSNKQLMKRI
jgi:N-acetylneuraminic acid mutarotase